MARAHQTRSRRYWQNRFLPSLSTWGVLDCAPMRRKHLVVISSLAALVLWQPRAEANFHLWTIDEIYSNADGSVQYIELVTAANGQHVLAGHSITASSIGPMRTFTFPANSPTGTTNKRLLLATPGF